VTVAREAIDVQEGLTAGHFLHSTASSLQGNKPRVEGLVSGVPPANAKRSQGRNQPPVMTGTGVEGTWAGCAGQGQ
jgi:hypothetical protein